MPEIDRTNADHARTVVERLLPDANLRLEVLGLLAALISQIAARKPQSWGYYAPAGRVQPERFGLVWQSD